MRRVTRVSRARRGWISVCTIETGGAPEPALSADEGSRGVRDLGMDTIGTMRLRDYFSTESV